MENEICTFKEYVFDILKYFVDAYRELFVDIKKKLIEITEVMIFIVKAIIKHKKVALMLMAFQFPVLIFYFSY